MWSFLGHTTAVALLLCGSFAAEIAVVPPSVPKNASPLISLSFPGFAFEEASFYLYATNSSGAANEFSQTIVETILNRTGGTPVIRVGGTSGDFGTYDASQQQPAIPDGRTNPPLKNPPYLSLGPKFFTAFANFPGARYMFMVPLARRNITNTVAWASQGLQNIPANALDAVEIGNEPDLYSWFQNSPQAYCSSYETFEKEIVALHPSLAAVPSFEGLDYARVGEADVSPQLAFDDGLNSTGGIRQIAYHYYEAKGVNITTLTDLQTHIVNHTLIRDHLARYTTELQAFRQINPTAPFILSECGNSLPLSAEERGFTTPQVNVLGTALWSVDFQLQAMTIGVTRVHMQQIFYPGLFKMWQPQDGLIEAAGVHANFYSQPLVADIIGRTNNTRVVELDLAGSADPPTIAAYAAYDEAALARIVIVNMLLWSAGQNTPRPVLNVTLTGLPEGSMSAKYLTAPEGGLANTTLTYAGQQWQYPSGRPVPTTPQTYNFTITSGILTVPMNATSAVLLSYIE